MQKISLETKAKQKLKKDSNNKSYDDIVVEAFREAQSLDLNWNDFPEL